MTRLTNFNIGDEAIVVDIEGGRGVRSKLFNLGLTPGIKIKIISRNEWGPIVLEVRDGKIAIGRGMAEKILVRPYKMVVNA